MKKNKHKKETLSKLLVFLIVFQIFLPFLELTEVQAENGDQIVQNLEIIGGNQGEYRPGDIINIKGEWNLADDSPGKEYKGGDTFSISIPDGLTASFTKIRLSNLGEGKVVGDKVVFTFNENVEQLMDRHGGFNLRFTVDTPEEEGEKEIDLDFRDENDEILLEEEIKVIYKKGEVIGESNESFVKASYPHSGEDELQWYIRVNKNKDLTDRGKVKIHDTIIGDKHELVRGSFQVSKQKVGIESTGDSIEANVWISEDKKSFSLDLDLSGDEQSKDGYWYTITYYTRYIGDYDEDIKSDDYKDGKLTLQNKVEAIPEDGDKIYPDTQEKDNTSPGYFDLGGWGEGKSKEDQGWGKAKIKKVDSITKKPLKGGEFKFYKFTEPETIYTTTSDENGIAKLETNGEYIDLGRYVIEEIKAPDGYKLDKEKHMIVVKANEEAEIVIENIPEPREIKVEKKWFDYKGSEIDPQEDIVVQLLKNNELIRQGVLRKGEELIFKNLPKVDGKGQDIDYEIREILPEGYEEAKIEGSKDEGFTIINTKKAPIEGPKVKVNIEKVWKNNEDTEILRTPTIELYRQAEGKEKELVDSVELKVGKTNHSFEDLDKYVNHNADDKVEWEYTIEELDMEGYNKSIELIDKNDDEISYKVTNTKEIREGQKFNQLIKIEKTWENDDENSRPDYIIIDILADGVPYISAKLTDKDNWSLEADKLPKYKEVNGEVTDQEIEYTIRELVPEDYTNKINLENKEDNTWEFSLVNTRKDELKQEYFDLNIYKEWVFDLKDSQEETIDNEGMIEDEKEVVLDKEVVDVEETEEDILETDLVDIEEIVDNELDEKELEEADLDLKTSDEANLENENKEDLNLKENNLKEDKEILLSKNENPEIPENIKVMLYADGIVIDEITVSSEMNWMAKFENLKKYRLDEDGNITGEEIIYEIRELDVEGYTAEYIELDDEIGFKIINRYDPDGELPEPEEPEEPEDPEEPEEPEIPEEEEVNGEGDTNLGGKPGKDSEVDLDNGGEKPKSPVIDQSKVDKDQGFVKLPATGSKTNIPFYLLGISLISLGLVLKIKRRKKK